MAGLGADEFAAGLELQEIIGGGGSGAKGVAPVSQSPFSSVSTSAGPTPVQTPAPHDGGSPGLCSLLDQDEEEDVTVGRGQSHRSASAQGTNGQIKKVFIGGIPQDMDQDDLRIFFSRFGDVKRAWLQRDRRYGDLSSPGSAHAAQPRSHRGFGFVIFDREGAVGQLLGDSFSRFIPLPSGRNLEVKRALSNVSLAETPTPPQHQQQQQVASCSGKGTRPTSRNALTQGEQQPMQQTPIVQHQVVDFSMRQAPLSPMPMRQVDSGFVGSPVRPMIMHVPMPVLAQPVPSNAWCYSSWSSFNMEALSPAPMAAQGRSLAALAPAPMFPQGGNNLPLRAHAQPSVHSQAAGPGPQQMASPWHQQMAEVARPVAHLGPDLGAMPGQMMLPFPAPFAGALGQMMMHGNTKKELELMLKQALPASYDD